MKVARLVYVILLFTISFMLNGCGSGSGASDTVGALVLSGSSATDNGGGTYKISTTVTYTPPAGKTAQGVQVKLTFSDDFGNSFTENHSFTSGSNIFTYSFPVNQGNSAFQIYIQASIGDMKSSDFVTVPGIGAGAGTLSVASSTSFAATDVVNTTKTLVVSGGTPPYSVTSSVPADISAAIGTFINEVDIRLLQAAVLPGVPASAIITVTDGASATRTITVNYFK